MTQRIKSVEITVWQSPKSAVTMSLSNPHQRDTVGKIIYDFRKSCGFPSYSVNKVEYENA